MAFPCVNPNLASFVDRTEELEILIEKVSFPTDQNNVKKPLSHERVVHLIGKSAIGKSLLLCKYHNQILNLENTQSIFLSFEDYKDFLDAEFVVRVLNFLCAQITIFLETQPLDTTGRTAQEISNMMLTYLDILQKKNNVAFLMDEVNMLSREQIIALEDYFLGPCLNLSNIVLILTGRQIVTGWKEFALRPLPNKNGKGNVMELRGFDFDKTREQINIVKPSAIDLAHKIHEISGGSPGKNKNILNQIASDPPQIVEIDALRACNQELYDAFVVAKQGLPENIASELLPALEALCILQDFDKEYEMPILLGAHCDLNGTWDVKRSSTLLDILSKIQVGTGRLVDWHPVYSAYSVEGQIKHSLEQELKLRNSVLWRVLHFTAMKMYAKWATEYSSDIFEKKRLYHKSVLRKNLVETLKSMKD